MFNWGWAWEGFSFWGFGFFGFENLMLLRTEGTFSLNCLTFVDFLSLRKCLAVAYFLASLSFRAKQLSCL